MKPQIITALDIGSGSVKGICAKIFDNGILEVIAHAQRTCFVGVRAGEVIKPEEVAKVIQRVKSELSKKANIKIRRVLVNIGGGHIQTVPSQGLVSVSRADQKISKEDIERVLKAAEAVNLPSNKEILECFPKEFIIDQEGGIKDPLGLEGIRLEVKVLLATIFSPVFNNLQQAVETAGLEIANISLSPLAVSRAVLSQEQKELGVFLVDIGFGTTSVCAFEKGDLLDFVVFPIGSSHITNDIAIGLRAEIQTAENIKQEYGTLIPPVSPKAAKEKIKLPEKEIEFSRKFLKDVVESRVLEIFTEVEKCLRKIAGSEPLPSGIVFTGGGSLLPGLVEFAKQKFKLPCRLGQTRDVKGVESEQFALCYGLALGFLKEGERRLEHKNNFSASNKIKRVFKLFLP